VTRSSLLFLDGTINLVLGGLLVAYPPALVQALGLPRSEPPFYPSILGAVLLGVGVALLVEGRRGGPRGEGLGLIGAAVINLCGGAALVYWLLWGDLSLPLRGRLFLWGLAVLLVVLSPLEIYRQRLGADKD
jgi:hypothetical protein